MGLNSKTSRALADVRLQLRTKKTRGRNPRPLTVDELHALELKSVRLQEQMSGAHRQRRMAKNGDRRLGLLSRQLANVRRQLKTGKTLGNPPRALHPQERDLLQSQLNMLLTRQRARAGARFLKRLGPAALTAQSVERPVPGGSLLAEEAVLAVTEDILYIMQNSRIPNEYKIGRTSTVGQRRLSLGSCMNFEMVVLATFPLWGHLETEIKRRLEPHRVKMGQGREWFKCNLPDIMHTIGIALSDSQRSSGVNKL